MRVASFEQTFVLLKGADEWIVVPAALRLVQTIDRDGHTVVAVQRRNGPAEIVPGNPSPVGTGPESVMQRISDDGAAMLREAS